MRHPARLGPLIVAAACAAGCGPSQEPTRFIPAPPGDSAAIAPAPAAATPPRPAPTRNIEMH